MVLTSKQPAGENGNLQPTGHRSARAEQQEAFGEIYCHRRYLGRPVPSGLHAAVHKLAHHAAFRCPTPPLLNVYKNDLELYQSHLNRTLNLFRSKTWNILNARVQKSQKVPSVSKTQLMCQVQSPIQVSCRNAKKAAMSTAHCFLKILKFLFKK